MNKHQNTESPASITLSGQTIPVYRAADVLVVGGGPAGHAAAVAAARSGADTVLLERYGYFGGMCTGGLVTMIHSLSDGTNTRVIAGLCQEWFDRLAARGGIDAPAPEEVGSADPAVLAKYPGIYFRCDGKLLYSARVDSELLKCALNDMVRTSGVHACLHALVTDVIMEGARIKGVVFESKSGRQAVLADAVIDASGDGDVLARAGAAFEDSLRARNRLANPALCFEFGNVDWARADEFRAERPEEHDALMKRLEGLGGFRMYFKTTRNRDTVCHFNMFLTGYDPLKVEDLTRLEMETRSRMMVTYRFFRENIPGFERCFILITAPQVGVRGSRRLLGAYRLTEQDALEGRVFPDAIAEFPPLRGTSPERPHVFIPFRALQPRETENLLAAGRTFASDEVVNEHFNTISHCITMGQAAGTACALAVKAGVLPREVAPSAIREALVAQGARFPSLPMIEDAAGQ